MKYSRLAPTLVFAGALFAGLLSAQQKELLESRSRRHLRMNDPRVKPGDAGEGDPFEDPQLRKAVEVLRAKL